ncbi:MAG: DnaJ domain-containing protein [Kofleriaceae bacterium]|nr:DnaJ domain-containing protein [Kofleriaceae bacterium]
MTPPRAAIAAMPARPAVASAPAGPAAASAPARPAAASAPARPAAGKPAPASDDAPTTERDPAPPRGGRATVQVLDDGALDADERAALAEDVEIDVDDRRRIFAMERRVAAGDPLAMLGVTDASDKKAIKRAYFVLSKEFHPDRYYGKRLGTFALRLAHLFDALAKAYATLTEDAPRRRGTTPSDAASRPPSPADYAAELFDRACQAEVSGDLAGALRLFASALRVDAPARYLRRASRCAMAAGEAGLALEYARKAATLEPSDPSTSRVLAAAFKAAGKLEQAEEVLVMAVMIPIENDQLMHELQADLADLRRRAGQ